MNSVEQIVVDDLSMLLTLMETSELWVEWQVRCDFGPDWIEGDLPTEGLRHRKVQFYIDQQPLADTPIHEQLRTALIKALDIPETSPDAVISGEGSITRSMNHGHTSLGIEYEWSEAVPYMYARDSGFGTAVLITLP